ncbi:MAG: 3-dehydroquinate synthase [bacterium]|nr:3-dehydroquinate synthase [bacterium]
MDSFELTTSSGVTLIRLADEGAEWIARELAVLFGARRPRVLVVTDEHVALHHLEALLVALRTEDFVCARLVIAPGEAQKSFARLREALDTLATGSFARDDVVLAFGGGVVTDLAGFAASVYRRGIEWIAAPTTVLGMVDAAIGGKTGINHEAGKNLIGSFHQPRAVLCATRVLATLPEREVRAGAAEIVKGALLGGGEFWRDIEQAGADATTWSAEILRSFILRGARVKVEIVGRDERESGERALLNLGHTFGHALEQATGYGTVAHGEAVFYGLRAAVWLSRLTGALDPMRADELQAWLARCELPGVATTPDALSDALRADKKTVEGKLRWILLRGPGEPFITAGVPGEAVRDCAEWLCAIAQTGRSARHGPRKRRVLVLHGPNLNLLGEREPEIYGRMSHDDIAHECREAARQHGFEVLIRQTNHEGDYVDLLQWGRRWADGLILNPGAFTHTSVAVRDALAATYLPAIEVHLSEPRQREEFRHVSLISELCRATVSGRGVAGYADAMARLSNFLSETGVGVAR